MYNKNENASVEEAKDQRKATSESTDNGANINVEADNSVSTTGSQNDSILSPAAMPAVNTFPKHGYLFWDKCRTCQKKCGVLLTDFPLYIPPLIYMNLWHRHNEVCPLKYKEICDLYSPHVCHFSEDVGDWNDPEYASVFANLKNGVYPSVFKNARKVYERYDSKEWELKFDDNSSELHRDELYGANPYRNRPYGDKSYREELYRDIYYDLKEMNLIHPNEDEYPKVVLYPKEFFFPNGIAPSKRKASQKKRTIWRKKMKKTSKK